MTRAFSLLAGVALASAPLFPQAKSKAAPAPSKAQAKQPATPAKSDPPATSQLYPLESVRVEGAKQIPVARVIAASGLKIGAKVQKSDFDDARERLIATGAYESVGYDYKPSVAGTGYDAVLQVLEAPQMFSLRFEDLPAPDATLHAALRAAEPIYDDKAPPSKIVMDRLRAIVEKSAGIPVAARVTADRGVSEIVFTPAAGRPNIAEVRFTGNQVMESPQLMRSLAGVAIGVPYSETSFRQLVDASLRPLYEARGRLRVEFPTVSVAPAEKVNGVVVTTSIREGEVYKLKTVSWQGVIGALRESVEKAADIKTGDIANFDDINNALRRVAARYRTSGFLKERATVVRSINDQAHEVSITITVDPGPQYLMGKLKINGLDIFSEPAVRKMWKLDEGKPFTEEYPEQFLTRVRTEDMFDNLGKTTAVPEIDEASHRVDVTLNFTGDRADKAKQSKEVR